MTRPGLAMSVGVLAIVLAPELRAPAIVPALPDARVVAQPLRTGRKVRVAASASMAVSIVAKDGEREVAKFDFPGSRSLACVATVGAADEAGCTSGRLAFGAAECSECDRLGGAPESKTPDFANRAYEVTRSGGAFVVRSDRGNLSREERETTAAIAAATLGLPPLGELLAGRMLRKGEKIAVPLALAERVLALLVADTKVRSLTLALTGERREAGADAVVFRARARLETEPGDDLDAEIDLSGEIVLDRATGLVLRISLLGPVKVTGRYERGSTSFDLEGTGRWTAEYSARVE